MRKISLKMEELRVESFATSAEAEARGTVAAHSGASCPYACTLDEPTCNGPACRTLPVLSCLC